MNSLKIVFSICTQNFRKWQTDYRVWCVAAALFAFIGVYVNGLRKVNDILGLGVPVWIFPFMGMYFFTKIVLNLPIVLLFCNAPFTDGNQTFVYMRSGRVKWLCGQILYIVFASAAYYLFTLLSSLLLTSFFGDFSWEWGETLYYLSRNPALQLEAGAFSLNISYMVLNFFSPMQAVWFTFLLSWLSGIFIGLTIFLCNLLSGKKLLGVLISSFLIVASGIIAHDFIWEKLLRFSPMSWTTLDNIDVGRLTSNPSFNYCVTVYAVLITVLIAAILIFGRKKSLDIKE